MILQLMRDTLRGMSVLKGLKGHLLVKYAFRGSTNRLSMNWGIIDFLAATSTATFSKELKGLSNRILLTL